jgi:anti-anti-sigma regulatory factor
MSRRPVAGFLEALVQENELVVADFSGALFVDASMLHVLVAADRLARERCKTFRLQLGTDALVTRTFEIAGLLEQIGWASLRDEALNGPKPSTEQESSSSLGGHGICHVRPSFLTRTGLRPPCSRRREDKTEPESDAA